MAFLHGKDTTVYFNDVELTPYLNSAALSATGDTADTSHFGLSWKTAIAGQLSATASFGGFHDVDLTEMDDTLGTSSGVLTFCPGGGDTIGDHAWLLSATSTTLARSAPLAGAVTFQWDVMVDTVVGFGTVLHPMGEDTNTTTGSSRDDSAATETGWVAHLHVSLVDGGSWVVKLQDSDNDSDWADVTGAAFTAATDVTSERLVGASGAELRQYVRYVATRTGGSAGQGITFHLSYSRNGI